MEVIEKEVFAFQLLNDIRNNHNLHPGDYTKLVGQIQEANTYQAMDGIIRLLGDITLI